MDKFKKIDCLAFRLAIFAMFFGAGNIIFPLALGQSAIDNIEWALSGFLLTAVVMPCIGLLTMFRYKGNITLFFSRLGKIPGLAIATLVISLLGPFGAAPRCIALMHSTLSSFFPGTSLLLFSISTCTALWVFLWKKNHIIKWLGYVLSPLMIALLILIIIKGFIYAPENVATSANGSGISRFWKGLAQGYNTMDLLAAFFFAPIVICSPRNGIRNTNMHRFSVITGVIGASLLSLVYIGFCYLSYFYAPYLTGISDHELLGTIAIKILGSDAGIIVGLTVVFACFTTAIALIAAFSDFLKKEIFREKIGYSPILIFSLLITCLIANYGFRGIANLLHPVLKIFYPALILLTVYNVFKSPQEPKISSC